MYKFGGMPLDGVVEGSSQQGASEPFIDNSISIGMFVYSGTAMLGPEDAQQENPFSEVGGDFNAWYDRCNLFGGIGVRHDDHPFLDAQGTSANTTTWFTELDVTVYPWLLPGIRFESWQSHMIDPGSGEAVSYTDTQIVPGVVFLLRANLKATLRASFAKQESLGDSSFQSGQVQLLLALGI
jgi:hypothetical protein